MSADEEQQQTAGRRRVLLIVGALVVVLVAAGVVTFLLTGNDEQDPTGGDQQTTAMVPTGGEQPGATQGSGAPPEPASEADVTAAKGVAEQAAAAFAEGDVEAMTRISCDPADDETPVEVGEDTTAELAGEPELTGDTGTVQLRISIGGSEPTLVPLPLEKRTDGTWCVP